MIRHCPGTPPKDPDAASVPTSESLEVSRVSDVRERVISLVAEKMDVDAGQITDETHFVNDLQSDSLDIAELVIDLEEEFDVTINDEDAQNIQTVGEAVAFIEAHM